LTVAPTVRYEEGVYVVCVRVEVVPEHADAFADAIVANAREARKEPGNVRFDVLRNREEPSRFLIYEAYRDEESFRAHQTTPHYLTWRQTVAPWMAAPRVGDHYRAVFPDPWE
jgi:(4S)-4-hydroxy-5-phosphonooxypentane-2,3-dione isomerase